MSQKFEVLTDVEHILKRPSMYIGSCVNEPMQCFVNGQYTTLNVVPGLLKIINEILDNSLDEFVRSNEKYANRIKIQIDKDSFCIEDNGRGIPIEKYQDEWRPKLSWCAARAGTSFSDNRTSPGANGVGSMIVNCFSTEFIGETYNGKKYCKVHCTDNLKNIKVNILSGVNNSHGTKVTVYPDFKRFGVDGISEDIITAITERVNALAATYAITFELNGKQIKCKKSKDFFSTFGNVYIQTDFQHGTFAIYTSEYDEYVQKSVINGLELHNGGTHEMYITRELSYALKDLIKKKHKLDLSPAEIKRCLKLVFIGHNFPDMEFDSQTKVKLTNNEKHIKTYLGPLDFEKLAKKIMGESAIIDPIIQAKLAKQLAQEARAVTLAQKKLAKVKVPKHVPAKNKNIDNTILFLVEGDSAKGSLVKNRNPEKHGVFPLRGNPLNVYGLSQKNILDNQELSHIMSILGLSMNEPLYKITLDNDKEIYAKESDYILIDGRWKKVKDFI